MKMRGIVLLLLLLCFPAFSASFISGTVSGLSSGKSFVLKSGKFSKTIYANGAYKINNGGALTIATQPIGQTCSILNTNITCIVPIVYVSVDLYWDMPTQNTDGTPLTDLTSYTLYYGTDPTLTTYASRLIPIPNLTTTVSTLIPGNTYYFSIASVSASGGEGPRSNIASVTK
jgi:hypothetical protein